ncbi:MAG: hypothetical protein OXU23_18455 [Candidatus Poribacteria bacterium]|nr:hypothetical protein [Candidatus Poribacteria bacterium]
MGGDSIYADALKSHDDVENTQSIKSEDIIEKEKAGKTPCLLLKFLSHSEKYRESR